MTFRDNRTALVLTGGGARAAYEVGVLRAIAELSLSDGVPSPFSIYCGTSGGALNAASLALSDDFVDGVRRLTSVWRGLHVDAVYRTERNWLPGFTTMPAKCSRTLFDAAPLESLLARELDFGRLESAIAAQSVRALCVTGFGHASGQFVSFFQGRTDLEPWQRGRRVGAHVALGPRHVLASMAMPFVFPPVKINREHFGDGAGLGASPLSPAVRLGARRILAIASHPMEETADRTTQEKRPGAAVLLGHVLSGGAALSDDIDRMNEINRLLAHLPSSAADDVPWRKIDLLVVRPSQRPENLAADVFPELPSSVRSVISRLGAAAPDGESDARLASHLLFESAYAEKLIDLGYRDGLARKDDIATFFSE